MNKVMTNVMVNNTNNTFTTITDETTQIQITKAETYTQRVANVTVEMGNVTKVVLLHPHRRHGPVEYIYTIIAILCFQALIGAFLNILTIISVLKFDKLRTTSNMLILSLSISGCLPIIAWMFNIFHEIYIDDRRTWNILCLGQVFCLVLSQSTMVIVIAYIATDRAISIIFPIWARNNITVLVMQRIVIAHWIIFLAINIVVIIFGNQVTTCEQKCEWVIVIKADFIKYCIQVGFILGSMVTLCMYIAILYRIRKMKLKVGTNTDKRQQKQLKINKMMGTGW